jgi:flagellar motor switch/type III secretory pathway protein FliN
MATPETALSPVNNVPGAAGTPDPAPPGAQSAAPPCSTFKDLPLTAEIVIAEKALTVSEIASLDAGSLVVTDCTASSRANLVVNGVLLARGELVPGRQGLRLQVREILVAPAR